MKVYLTYEINEAELHSEVDSITDTECFRSLATAIDHIIERIENGVVYGFVPDQENEEIYDIVKKLHWDKIELHKAIEKDFNCGRYFSLVMFEGYQENWQCYYTIVIEEKELQ